MTAVLTLPKVELERFLADPERWLAEVETGTVIRITRLGFTVAVLTPESGYLDPAEIEDDKIAEVEGALDDISSDVSSLRHDFRRWRDELAKAKK